MSAKILFVSSAVQAALMTEIFIPELTDGFWKNHRPAGHGEVWRDVKVEVTTDGALGPVGFDAPRNYNFLNLEFALPNEARLVEVARSVKDSSNFKSVKKELIELGRIVGSRLASSDAEPLKLFRGNHKPGTQTVSSARARAAANTLGETGKGILNKVSIQAAAAIVTTPAAPKPAGPKRTVQKIKAVPVASETTTAAGATVRRVPVQVEPAAEAASEETQA